MKPNIPLNEVWMYFWRNHSDFTTPGIEALIAKNDATGILLCMGKSGNYPELRVYMSVDEAEPHVVRTVMNKEDCITTAARLFATWLSDDVDDGQENEKKSEPSAEKQEPEAPEQDEEGPEESDMTPEDMIYERETDLHDAMGDLLATVLCEHDGIAVRERYGQKLVDKCVDWFLEYLADAQGISVYRPMLLKNNAGEEELIEFPYGEDA